MPDNVLSFTDDFNDDQGMYGTGEDTYLEELTVDNGVEYLMQGDYHDVYGFNVEGLNDNNKQKNPFTSSRDGFKAYILGMPLAFNKMADPSGRTFKNTIMEDLPIIFIVPGKTVLNGKLVSENGGKIGKGSLLSAIGDSTLDVLKIGVRGARSGNDVRFLGFKADYGEFFAYVSTFLSTLYATMGLQGIFSFDDFYKESMANYGLCFYGDNSTSISESNSNDFTETSVAQQANTLSAQNREAKLMLGINTSGESGSLVGKALTFITRSVSELAEGITSLTGILGRAGNIFGRVVNGSQLLYPEIWTNSVFDRSYQLNFKFYSPYGSKDAIFKFCYVPFACWVCLSFPRQDNVMGFGQPFVMRISAPGYFESSLAVVTSITFTRGGNDNLWTIDNLPTEITVQVTVKDLYSALPITKKFGMMSYNIGLSSFIDCLAGIRSDQLSLLARGEIWIKTRLSVPSKLVGQLTGKGSDFGYHLQSKINDFLR